MYLYTIYVDTEGHNEIRIQYVIQWNPIEYILVCIVLFYYFFYGICIPYVDTEGHNTILFCSLR